MRSSFAAPARFLALGDSYTIGEAVPVPGRWPERLVARLASEGVAVAAPEIIARTGWTTDELEAGIAADRPRGPFDLVSLLIGVNDQYRGRPASDYRLPFASLLQMAIGFAGRRPSRVVVLSIPDWGATPFAAGRDRLQVAREIDAYNAIGRTEAVRARTCYVDVTPISRQASTDTSLLAADGLHPSAKMYDAWTVALMPVARRILRA